MKTLFLTALLILPIAVFSQSKKPIDSFLGIKFGSSKTEVISAMKAIGSLPVTVEGDTTVLYFPSVPFENATSDLLQVSFIDSKAYKATFRFPYHFEVLTTYRKIVDAISKIHGKVEGTAPDRDTLIWTSKKDDNFITIFFTKNTSIMLVYTDKSLSDLATSQKKAKQKADF